MEIRLEQGNRGWVPEDDRKIFVRTNGWELWGYEHQLLDILLAFCENEDRIYPPSMGGKGRKYLMWFLNIAAREGHEVAIRKNEARKREAQQQRLFYLDDGGQSDSDAN